MQIERDFGAIRSHGRSAAHRDLLLSVCKRERLTLPQTAYVLATVQHETRMGLWMIDHESGWAYEGRHYLGNIEPGDGPRFRGRGYVPLIGRSHYAQWQRRLALPLLEQPELAAEPQIAAEIAVQGMNGGSFTGHRLSDFINESSRDYVAARRIIRDRDRAVLVASLAVQFEQMLRPEVGVGARRPDVIMAQRQLKVIGWPLVVDGILGTFTQRALADFQRGYTFEPLTAKGGLEPETARALTTCAADGGYASPHFRFCEFRTGGSHRLCLNNRVISVSRELVHGMERYRNRVGEPVRIASGYRSVAYNTRIAGSATSRHLDGMAADVWQPRLGVADVIDLGVFTTIGTSRGQAVHLEITPGGSSERPDVFPLDR